MAYPCKKFLRNGGIGQRDIMHLLCAYFTLQNEYEMVEFRQMWDSCNDLPCGGKYQEPLNARWEFAGIAAMQFLYRVEGFKRMDLEVKNI